MYGAIVTIVEPEAGQGRFVVRGRKMRFSALSGGHFKQENERNDTLALAGRAHYRAVVSYVTAT